MYTNALAVSLFTCRVAWTLRILHFMLELLAFFTLLVYTTMGYRQTVQDVAERSMKAAVEEVTGGEVKVLYFSNFVGLIVLCCSVGYH